MNKKGLIFIIYLFLLFPIVLGELPDIPERNNTLTQQEQILIPLTAQEKVFLNQINNKLDSQLQDFTNIMNERDSRIFSEIQKRENQIVSRVNSEFRYFKFLIGITIICSGLITGIIILLFNTRKQKNLLKYYKEMLKYDGKSR